jgi:hypothetical protein
MALAQVCRVPVFAGPSILISEVMFNPKEISDTLGEWIELSNLLEQSVDLSGFSIHDQSGKSFGFEPGTVIGADGVLIIARSAVALAQWGQTALPAYFSFALNNGGDVLLLRDNDGQLLDIAAWGGALAGWDLLPPEGHSLQRISLLGNPAGWIVGQMPTPGQFATPGALPEPTTFVLLGLGLGVVVMRRRKLRA